ncbi:MAG: acyl-CoA dehydrogenase family protein [Dehalococcoidia bacterium]
MDFSFTEEQEMWRTMMMDFTEKEAGREYTRMCDQEKHYPQELWEAGNKEGFLGLLIPKEWGGMGSGAIMYAIFMECLAKYSYEMASLFSVPMFCAMNLVEHGTKEQQDQYLPPFVKGEQRFSVAITEPEAGSDASAVACQADDKGDHFVLNGQKQFSTAAHLPGNIVFMAVKTDKNAKPARNGISVLLVPNDAPGIEVKRLPLIVRRAIGTCSIFCGDAKIPKKNLVGELNGGWQVLVGHLELERLAGAAPNVGEAQCCLDDAINYAKERVQFGKPICKNQGISHMLADLQAQLDAVRLLTYRAAWMIDQKIPCRKEVSMAKMMAGEVFYAVTTASMQTFGGYSFLPESDIERHWRLSKMFCIGGGTTQIQRMIIARDLGM